MPAAPIPFSDGQASGIEELVGASPAVINVIHDAGDAVRTRPGLSAATMFPAIFPDSSAVIGMWVFGQYVVYCTKARNLFALIAPGLIVWLGDATPATQLAGSLRPQAVVTLTRIVIIGGGVPQKWEGAGFSQRLGGNPPAGCGIAYLAQRLVISDNTTGIIYWSQPGELGGGHEDWRGDMESAEAEASPDPLVALGTTTGEIFAFGTRTTQAFISDPDGVFIPGPSVEVGTISGASVVRQDSTFVFLDDRRRVVSTDGRSITDLSTPSVAQTIARFTTVSDCWSFRALIDGIDLLGFVFPTEGRACVYNSTVKKWGEWRSIDTNGAWLPWMGVSHCYWPAQNVHLVGLGDGTIVKLDSAAFTENGKMLKALIRTGFGDRATGNRKICERVQLTMRRGSTSSTTTAPVVLLSWRDNVGPFGRPLKISLGKAGDTAAQINTWTLGLYNVRQWELSMSDPSQFVLTGAEETFTPLEA